MHWSGDRATLTLTHLNKEDEGLYTLRVTTKSGYETYSAYIFVRGKCPDSWNLICEITQIATLCFRKHFENVVSMSSDDTARTSVSNVLKQFQGEHGPCCVDCKILFFHFNRHATPNYCIFYPVIFTHCSHSESCSVFWQLNYYHRLSLLWLTAYKWHVKLSVGG